jgi:hypothetical protein
LVRLALSFYELLNSGSATFDLVPLAEAWLIGVVAVSVLLDARRRSEDVLLGNLGVPAWMIAVMGCPLAVLLEVLVP